MSAIAIPDTLREMLANLKEPTELRDHRGNLLGRFTPERAGGQRPFREPPLLSEEEWQRIEAQPSYFPEEVMAHLEKL